jgi:hypothetical protein
MIIRATILFVAICVLNKPTEAQQLLPADSLPAISSKYLEEVSSRADKISGKIDKQSEKALAQLKKQEEKLKRKLAKIDSSKAEQLFGDVASRYKEFDTKLNDKANTARQYIPSLDTLNTSLKFIGQNTALLSKVKDGKKQLDNAMSKVKGLEQNFQKAENIKQYLKERRQYLKQHLQQFGFAKDIKKLNKQVYYYSTQLGEYKALLKDRQKAERKAMELLSKTKVFKDFMRKNSELASLFRLPGGVDDPASAIGLAGLQTRAQVTNLVQQQIAAGGPNAQAQLQQNLKEAQNQLQSIKNEFGKFGKGSSDDILPEGFKPNSQKTKSFWQRLEYGTNIQSQKPNSYLVVTSDIGLSLGYKLNDKSMIGVGASYKMGWGQNIRNIKISHQGAGLRSFADVKLKGSFWISGGYEMNYFSEFDRIRDILSSPPGGAGTAGTQFGEGAAWQQSGLLGMSKIISLKTKFLKKTKLQLLWDFLSYQQVPRTQPVVFRVNYSFN